MPYIRWFDAGHDKLCYLVDERVSVFHFVHVYFLSSAEAYDTMFVGDGSNLRPRIGYEVDDSFGDFFLLIDC